MHALWAGSVIALAACTPAVAPSVDSGQVATATSARPDSLPNALRGCSPGTYNATFRDHRVRVHIPVGASGRLPAVILLHGAGDTGPFLQKQSGMDAVADRQSFITVYPTAPSGDWPLTASGTGFVNALADQLPCALRNRTYLTGFSRGSAMTFHVACSSQPRRFAAFGGVAFPDFGRRCRRAAPAPWIYFHGSKDMTINYRKGYYLPSGRQTPGARQAMRKWAKHNRCAAGPKVARYGDVTLRTWRRCAAGADIRFYTIRDGDHQWPFKARPDAGWLTPGQSWAAVGASQAMWRFFSRHTLVQQ
jgi:polyhydroxybutyrate depolymerase